MRYIFLLLTSFLVFSCSSYKNVSYQESDGIYHINSDNSELVVSNTTTTTRFVNVYQNDFIYTPIYVNNWYNTYWGWNNSWNRFYWNNPNYYWSWNTWNHPNYWIWNNGWNSFYWNHPNYLGWNQPYQYNPYVWNRGRRGSYFSPRSVEPGRLTPNNSFRYNRGQSVRPTPTRNNNSSVRPTTPTRNNNSSVRPTPTRNNNSSVRPTPTRNNNSSVRPTPTRG